MQAISRKHLDRPPRPGVLHRQEFEYVRHGTQALIAALDVHSGKTLAACGPSRTQVDLLAFMEQVAKAYPQQQVHIVWDNLNTHRAYREFRQARGRMRHVDGELDAWELASTLHRYSERGDDYVQSLRSIMRDNRLEAFDTARLNRRRVATIIASLD